MVIVSAVSNYNITQIKPLIDSVRNVGYTGHRVMLIHNVDKEAVEYLLDNNWRIISIELEMLIHIQRYREVFKILGEYKDNEQVIFIDGKDVFFYKNPETWNLSDKLYVGIDGNGTHSDHEWGRENFYKSFPDYIDVVLDKPHLNCGVIIGENKDIRNLLIDIFDIALTSNQRDGVDPFTFTPDDQMALNLLAHTKYKNLLTIQKPEDRYIINLAQTKWDREQYYLYHQYDRIKDFFNIVKNEENT